MSATYEREFKGILGGDARVLEGTTKTLGAQEHEAYSRTVGNPFLVVRAAGSLGADLVAVRRDLSFLVEVKSSKRPTLYFSDSERLSEQIDTIRHDCERAGVLPIYAFRRKGVRGDAWRVFTMPDVQLDGRPGALWGRLPKIAFTGQGNHVLRWNDGMPLARFLAQVCEPAPASTPAPGAVAAEA